MSDEEDVGATLTEKSPPWRSAALTSLTKELDECHQRQSVHNLQQVVGKQRIVGESPMKRKQSNRLSKDLME